MSPAALQPPPGISGPNGRGTALDAFMRIVDRARSALHPQSKRSRALVAAVLVVVFVAGTALAAHSLRLRAADIHWSWIVLVALVGVPIGLLLNVLELYCAASVAGRKLGVVRAVQVTVLASAANLLPIPGAVVVRMEELARGRGTRAALAGTAFVGLVWVGTTCLIAAPIVWLGPRPTGAIPLGVIGAATTAIGSLIAGRALRRAAVALVALTVIVEALFAVVLGLRLWACAQALGHALTLRQGLVVGASAALASAIGIFPGGLGLGEVLAGALSPLAGLPVTVGFITSGLNRVVGIAVNAPAALLVARGEHDGGA